MQKKTTFVIVFVLLIALIFMFFRSCEPNPIDHGEVIIDTTYIITIDTVFTKEYVIVTTSVDSIFVKTKKIVKTKDADESKVFNNNSKISDNNSNDSINSKDELDETTDNFKKNSGNSKKNNEDKKPPSDSSNENSYQTGRADKDLKEIFEQPKDPIDKPLEIDTFYETKTTIIEIDTFLNLGPIDPNAPNLLPNEPINPNNPAHYRKGDNAFVTSPIGNYTLPEIAKLEPFLVPIKFHEINTNNGSEKVLASFYYIALIRDLNKHFQKANIQFIQCGMIDYTIHDSKLYDFPKLDYNGNEYNFQFLERIMAKYNQSKVLNIYLVNTMGGGANGLYPGQESKNNPESMLVIRKDQMRHGVTEHEIGHWLFLRHTHNFESPDRITSELVDGSNCTTTGDMICDTKADPNLAGNVGINCNYTNTSLKDAKGRKYNPDVKNLMSYSTPNCVNEFSDDQLKRMAILVRSELRNFISYENCMTDFANTPAAAGRQEIIYSDISIADINIIPNQDDSTLYNVSIKIVNEGRIATPINQGVKLEYFVNSRKADSKLIIKDLAIGDSQMVVIPVQLISLDTILEFEAVLGRFTNEQNASNNTLAYTLRIQKDKHQKDDKKPDDGDSDDTNQVEITDASKECPTSTELKLKTIYTVLLDFSSIFGADGYWFKFYVPNGRIVKTINIYDVSENFDPVVGVKSNCAYANFIPNDYNKNSINLLNENGLGKSEIFYNDFYGLSTGNNGFYHFKINHAQEGQNPKVTFKIYIQ